MAEIIAVINQKGGAAKSTLSWQIANYLNKEQNISTQILDLDPQGTCVSYAQITESDIVTTDPEQIVSDYVIVDTPAYLSEDTVRIIQSASKVLLPCTASPADLISTLQTVNQIRSLTEDFVVIITKIKPFDPFNKIILNELEQLDVPLMRTHMWDRVAYKKIYSAQEASVSECKDPKAKRELASITEELFQI